MSIGFQLRSQPIEQSATEREHVPQAPVGASVAPNPAGACQAEPTFADQADTEPPSSWPGLVPGASIGGAR